MIAVALVEVALTVAPATLASSSQGGGGGWLLLLGPAGGAALYVGLWSYYRNTGASHGFERETRVTAQPVTGHDVKVDEVSGTRATEIPGDNRSNHRQRVQRQ